VTITPQIDVGLQAQLELARQVQLRLLPERRCCLSDWEVAFSTNLLDLSAATMSI
jgi:hypothetical protein